MARAGVSLKKLCMYAALLVIPVWLVSTRLGAPSTRYEDHGTAACFLQMTRGFRPDTRCDAFLDYLQETVRKPRREQQQQQNEGWDSLSKRDCYTDLAVFSNKSEVFPNRTHMRLNYLDSFRQCGHEPELLSQKVVARPDNLSLPVPNVVHYIWAHQNYLPPTEIHFLQYMSVLSVSKYIRPTHILWHGSEKPFGYWWDRTVAEVPNIYYVQWYMPSNINGKFFGNVQHKSDLLRLWILIVHGGMYLDSDVVVLRSFDPLRVHKATIARELRYTVANGIILSEPWSLFLRIMLDTYSSYDKKNFVRNSMILPNRIVSIFPHLIHVEPRDLLYPTWPDIRKMYTESFNWTTNYCVHIFGEETFGHLLPNNTQQMDAANYTLATILRQVYYDKTST